ncbi:hypothetical protein [Rosenbergiella australiborealis]|uniref:hypothetical protein n=1 Tax=Rosenbergiella australiborealis TaxID=1544696 RepID=UPI001F4EC93C|nr:hypothetical protein [Rosenbergiella australiborealis]
MDSKIVINAIINELSSLPNDLYLGIERTVQDLAIFSGGSKIQQRNIDDDKRLLRALEKIHSNRIHLVNMATLIIKNALSYLPDSLLKELTEKIMVTSVSVFSRQVCY